MDQNAVVRYCKESFQELHKVTWPTKNQAVKVTVMVLVFTAFASVFLLGVDFVLGNVYKLVFVTT